MRCRDLADRGNELGIHTRLDGRAVPAYQVASTVHSYREDFDVRDGVVTLRAAHTALRGVTEEEKTIAALPVPTDSELRPWRGTSGSFGAATARSPQAPPHGACVEARRRYACALCPFIRSDLTWRYAVSGPLRGVRFFALIFGPGD